METIREGVVIVPGETDPQMVEYNLRVSHDKVLINISYYIIRTGVKIICSFPVIGLKPIVIILEFKRISYQ